MRTKLYPAFMIAAILYITSALFYFQPHISRAQSCNTGVPWYTDFGTYQINNTPIFGPACNQLQDSGINIVTMQANLQSQINAISSPTLLTTLTAINSANLQDTTHITSTYPEYEIVLENIIPASASQSCQLLIHSGGTFQNATYLATSIGESGASPAFRTATTNIPCDALDGTELTTAPGFSGRIYIVQPSQTTQPKMVYGMVASRLTSPAVLPGSISGYWNGGNGAVDGFEILMSSGNITSGTVKLYGLP